MTEKERFEVKHNIPIGSNHYGIIDNATGKKYGKRKYDSQQLCNEINKIVNENEELRQDNDIKYWKFQCLQSLNNNQMMLFELSRVIQQGYEVSDKFKQYLDEIKEHNKEIREKHKRLFE